MLVGKALLGHLAQKNNSIKQKIQTIMMLLKEPVLSKNFFLEQLVNNSSIRKSIFLEPKNLSRFFQFSKIAEIINPIFCLMEAKIMLM